MSGARFESADRDLLEDVLSDEPPPFALLHRPNAGGPMGIDVIVGDAITCRELADIPVPHLKNLRGARSPERQPDVLALVPYRQIRERGFAAVDDGAQLIALLVRSHAVLSREHVIARIRDEPIDLREASFDIDDEAYGGIVRQVVSQEIGTGEGANFVIHRSYRGVVRDYTPRQALSLFRRLLESEVGAHWTFVVHVGDRTLVGASPERHVCLDDGMVSMNPISGTYRYPPTGPRLNDLLDFLDNGKENDELYMVLDEELKMMSRICSEGSRVVGPFLREMAHVAHTEYLVEGRTQSDVHEILRETMFAPTVTGSPLENACRVIKKYEPEGRQYYSGYAALIGHDGSGTRWLDSCILIRTADIDSLGNLRIGVGGTLVRSSDPVDEAAETVAKVSGLLRVMDRAKPRGFDEDPQVRAALAERNTAISEFWLGRSDGAAWIPDRSGRLRILVVDAEDTFTSMLRRQLASLGFEVVVMSHEQPAEVEDYHLVVLGPGPGDPCGLGDPRIERLRDLTRLLLSQRHPFLSVCLSHQILSSVVGLDVVRRSPPMQGLQREIDFFGTKEKVGFYNTFTAVSGTSVLEAVDIGRIDISRDVSTGEVHALLGPFFASTQFHPESVLTQRGTRILAYAASRAMYGPPSPSD